jgi:peptidoglycan/LPS O-acetylase OafA/YrhL
MTNWTSGTMHSESRPNGAPLGYMMQLDGLRCLAVLAVMFEHFFPTNVRLDVIWGRLGVRLFFVLSGFLITSLLLQCKKLSDTGQQTRLFSVRQFYFRRFLRIIPLFYASIVVMSLLGPPEVARSAPWHFAYLSNIYAALPLHEAGLTSHFWSLAVEEQFYFMWPWLILFVPWRILPAIICMGCAVGPGYRLCGVMFGWSHQTTLWLTPACLDTLSLGSLLAYLMIGGHLSQEQLRKWSIGALLIGLITLIYAYSQPRTHPFMIIMGDVGCGMTFSSLVYFASIGRTGFLGRILQLPPIVYLGKISYGIYIIHFFVPYLYRTFLIPAGLPDTGQLNGNLSALIYVALTIAVADCSWRFYEKPLNNLKRHFPYRKGGSARL